MKKKFASIFALLGFATVALVEAVKGAPLAQAVPRMILAAVVMAVIGYGAGLVAEQAVREAVDTKVPEYKGESAPDGEETGVPETEEE